MCVCVCVRVCVCACVCVCVQLDNIITFVQRQTDNKISESITSSLHRAYLSTSHNVRIEAVIGQMSFLRVSDPDSCIEVR